jgi:hypothetical protein
LASIYEILGENMERVIGYKTKKVYFEGSAPACRRFINGLSMITKKAKGKKAVTKIKLTETLLIVGL